MKTDPFKTIGLEKLNERAKVIKNNPEFAERCKKAISETIEEKLKYSKEDPQTAEDPHNQLYSGGFLDEKSLDSDIIKKFHTIDWDKRYEQVLKIKDKRFKYFGERLIYQNEPEALPKEVYNRIHTDTAERVLRLEEKNFTTIPMAEHLIDSIRAEKDISKEKLDYINEVDAMIKEMRVIYEKALAGKKINKNSEDDVEIPRFLKGEVTAKEVRKGIKDLKKQNITKIKKDIA